MNRDDSRIRKVPMFFGRPNLTEMNRVYRELVTVTLGPAESQPIPEEILAPVEMASPAIHKTEEATNSPVEASEPEKSSTEPAPSEDETNLLYLLVESTYTRCEYHAFYSSTKTLLWISLVGFCSYSHC